MWIEEDNYGYISIVMVLFMALNNVKYYGFSTLDMYFFQIYTMNIVIFIFFVILFFYF